MHVQPALDKNELRNFGFAVGSIFIILFGLLLPFLRSNSFPVWPWIIAVILFMGAFIAPIVLKPIYAVWMKVGHILGCINTTILLSIIFILLITPIGLLIRFFGRDPMQRKFETNLKSYRIKSKISSRKKMEEPF